MPGRVLEDSVVSIVNDIEARLSILESSGWTIPPGGTLTLTDSSDRTRVILGVQTDGEVGIKIYNSSGSLTFDQTFA
jgi:hypothetical protein